MESKEQAFLKKLRLKVTKKLNTVFVGEYHSAFKGFGLSFDSVREYQFGDDVRNIDWNVSARMNHLYIKEYMEERELSVVLMVDISGSTKFGTTRSKYDVIMEMVTLLLYLSQMNNDRISILLFSDKVDMFIKPQKGRKFILKVLDEILKCKSSGTTTNMSSALSFAHRVLKKRSVIFLISDFITQSQDYIQQLKYLQKKHDIIPVQVHDPLEKEMKFYGLVEFYDLESKNIFLSDTIPEKGKFPELVDFDNILLSTQIPIEEPILKFFEKRNRTKLVR